MKSNTHFLAVAFSVICSANFTIAQDNSIPNSGNVGLGTLNPTARLDVNGRVEVDSSLLVRDSVRVQKNMRVEQDLKVDGKVVMLQNSVAKEDFKVDGTFRLPNASPLGSNNIANNNFRFLLLNDNGGTRTGTMDDLSSKFVQEAYGSTCRTNSDGSFSAPTWQSVPVSQYGGYLITGINCPAKVGIGIDTPQESLHTIGNGIFSGILGVGTNVNNNTQLNINSNRRYGINVDYNYAIPNNGYAILSTVHQADARAFGINNTNINNDVFQIYGDGRTTIGKTASVECLVKVDNTDYPFGLTIDHSNLMEWGSAILIYSEFNNNFAMRVHDKPSNKDVFRLYNNGTVWATEINVALKTDFPDYVFDSSYDLMSFDQLRSYISKEKHLPGLRSAAYYHENGINTAELHVKEIEKIEELTLYVLSLEERIAELEKLLTNKDDNDEE